MLSKRIYQLAYCLEGAAVGLLFYTDIQAAQSLIQLSCCASPLTTTNLCTFDDQFLTFDLSFSHRTQYDSHLTICNVCISHQD